APFGILDVRGNGRRVTERRCVLESALSSRIRRQARLLNVPVATLFHAVWALVVSRTTDREDIVFGTVVSGRLRGTEGIRRTIGLLINTLPLKLSLRGLTAKELVDTTHRELAELLNFERASLADSQSYSGVDSGTPL